MKMTEFLHRLHNVKKSGDGWIACCPAHDDNEPSLSISEGKDGRILLKCHAGCNVEDICRALGIEQKDLFLKHETHLHSRMVETYDYTTPSGTLLFQVCRYEPKDFRQRRTDPNKPSHWIWNMTGVERVLYRLPKILKAKAEGQPIFVGEGEKDTGALESLGLAATCNPGGAGKWQESYTGTLTRAQVVIIAHKDVAGRKHAALVQSKLEGKAESVHVIEMPDRDGHKVNDVADWIAAGGTREEFKVVVKNAPDWTPPEDAPVETEAGTDPLERVRRLKKGDKSEDIGCALRDAAAGLLGKDKLTVTLAREECKAKLKELGITGYAKLVNAAFEPHTRHGKESSENGKSIFIEDPELWPEPVEGIELLQEIKDTIERYVVLSEHSATAAALWVLHAHTHEVADISPFLALLSPEKRCGKTSMLQVVGKLSPRRMFASNISPAALFRAVEKWRPTLLIDEADTFLKRTDNPELRGILNSGHTKTTAYVVRCVEPNFEPATFKTWCPKIIAMIGTLPDTVEDRSIICQLRRKSPGEKVERLRADRLDALDPVCRKAWRWGQDNLETLRTHEPSMPPELHDRAADNWRLLLAVAEIIGGDWPEHARHAAIALSCHEAGDTESMREQLLADIRSLFESGGTDRLFSGDIVCALVEMDGRPWPEYSRGKPITKTKLARLLKPFGITSRDVRIGTDHAKGYLLQDFRDAFSRYLPPSQTVTLGQPLQIKDEGHFSNRDTEEACHVSESPETPANKGLSRCHVSEPPTGAREGVTASVQEFEEGIII